MPLRILFADDSMTAQNMGKKILTEAGYEVIAVSNGAAAVKKIAEHKPDIIILDVYMPGYSGLEVCEKVRASIETLKTPVLLTVGKMEPYKPEDANRVKADGVIIKPFEASDLLAIVKKLEERIVPPAVPPLVQHTIRLERPPDFAEFAVHATGNSAPVSAAAIAATQDDLDENTVQPTVDVPDHMATVSAFSDLLGTDTAAEFSAPIVDERPTGIASTTPSPDPSSTFTSIPEFETNSSFASTAEVAPPRLDWEPAAELHSEFAVAPERPSIPETSWPPENTTVPESVSVEAESVEVSGSSAEVSPPEPSAHSVSEAIRDVRPVEANSDGVYPDTQPIPVYEEPEAPGAQAYSDEFSSHEIRLEPAAATRTEAIPFQHDPAFEPTQAEAVAEAPAGIAPGLVPTSQEQSEVSVVADPNLVTERAALDSFPTRFGVEDPEDIPVGVASDFAAFDMVPQQAAPQAEGLEAGDIEPRPEASSAPASADDDFEARVAAAMHVYGEPAETRVQPAHAVQSDEAHTAPATASEDDFEARVAAALASYEEPQPTAAFAGEMETAPVHDEYQPTTETATIPTESRIPVEHQMASVPAFHAQNEVGVPGAAPETAGSFEYSPPVSGMHVHPEPEVAFEPPIESVVPVRAEVFTPATESRAHPQPEVTVEPQFEWAPAVQHFPPRQFVETVREEEPPHLQMIAHEPAQDVSQIVASEATQSNTERITARIGAEMPVEAVAAAAAATGADSDLIAQVVHRVMERLKPEMVAAIVRELNSQK